MNPPRKTHERNIVPDANRPWEAMRVAYPCTVMEDQGRYRMWYDARYEQRPDEDTLPRRFVCYAELSKAIYPTAARAVCVPDSGTGRRGA